MTKQNDHILYLIYNVANKTHDLDQNIYIINRLAD